MSRLKPFVIVGLVGLAVIRGASQDARAVLGDTERALGATGLSSLTYAGTGFAYAFGQNPRPDVPYPKFYARYSRAIDFQKGISREETTRSQFENPPKGGGGQPLYTDAVAAAVSGDASAWGGGAVALTPHGFVKAALAANPTMSSAKVGGTTFTVVSFTARDRFKVSGYIGPDHLVARVDTWVPNPTLGDTLIRTDYTAYKDFGGVKVPTHVVQAQGGYPVLDVTLGDVKPNAAVDRKSTRLNSSH